MFCFVSCSIDLVHDRREDPIWTRVHVDCMDISWPCVTWSWELVCMTQTLCSLSLWGKGRKGRKASAAQHCCWNDRYGLNTGSLSSSTQAQIWVIPPREVLSEGLILPCLQVVNPFDTVSSCHIKCKTPKKLNIPGTSALGAWWEILYHPQVLMGYSMCHLASPPPTAIGDIIIFWIELTWYSLCGTAWLLLYRLRAVL